MHCNCQLLKGKDVAYTMDGFNKLFMEFIYLDEEEALLGHEADPGNLEKLIIKGWTMMMKVTLTKSYPKS